MSPGEEGWEPPDDALAEEFRRMEAEARQRACLHKDEVEMTVLGQRERSYLCVLCSRVRTEGDKVMAEAKGPRPGEPGTPGFTGRSDQVAAGMGDLARTQAAYYRGLVAHGVPDNVAREALLIQIVVLALPGVLSQLRPDTAGDALAQALKSLRRRADELGL